MSTCIPALEIYPPIVLEPTKTHEKIEIQREDHSLHAILDRALVDIFKNPDSQPKMFENVLATNGDVFASFILSRKRDIPVTNTFTSNIDEIDCIDGPIMPPKRKYRVTLRVRKVIKGKPSICDERGW